MSHQIIESSKLKISTVWESYKNSVQYRESFEYLKRLKMVEQNIDLFIRHIFEAGFYLAHDIVESEYYDFIAKTEKLVVEKQEQVPVRETPEIRKPETSPEEPRVQVLRCVPFQVCPLCVGKGQVHSDLFYNYNQTASIGPTTCPTCHGSRIIPMHVIEQNASL